jgi:hypothetical protein
MAGDLLQSLFIVGPEPKQKFSTTIREKVPWSEAWEILKDLRKSLKI